MNKISSSTARCRVICVSCDSLKCMESSEIVDALQTSRPGGSSAQSCRFRGDVGTAASVHLIGQAAFGGAFETFRSGQWRSFPCNICNARTRPLTTAPGVFDLPATWLSRRRFAVGCGKQCQQCSDVYRAEWHAIPLTARFPTRPTHTSCVWRLGWWRPSASGEWHLFPKPEPSLLELHTRRDIKRAAVSSKCRDSLPGQLCQHCLAPGKLRRPGAPHGVTPLLLAS
jgi:hypothetical protein